MPDTPRTTVNPSNDTQETPMYIEIHHNTAEPLNETDRALLQALLTGEKAAGKAATTNEDAQSEPKPAAKKAAAAKPAPKAEPEPEESEEDLVGEDGPTIDDAKKIASGLVSSGKAAQVKAALAAVGAKKVSEVKPEDVAAFIEALEG